MPVVDRQMPVSLPEDLQQQFTALEHRLWKTETLVAVCSGACVLLLSILALFISDRLWDTASSVRLLFTFIGAGGVLSVLFLWLQRWTFARRDQRDLANYVQKRHRRLGDRLLGIVELADEKSRPAHFSPALYRAAIEQVAAEARKFDFPATVSSRPARQCGLALLVVLALSTLPVVFSPAAALNVLQRWCAPTARIPRVTLVTIENVPRTRIVPHGEAFVLPFTVQYRSIWRPAHAFGRIGPQAKIAASRDSQQFQLRVPGQVQPGVLRLQIGDARAEVEITPMHRPSLKELSASIEYPSYLQYPPAKENAESGSLSVLEGSRVSFSGKASRELAGAHLKIPDQDPVPMNIKGEQFSNAPLDLPQDSEVSFTWHDRYGLGSAGPWRLQVRAQKDSPPTPQLPGMLKDTALLESEVLDIKTVAQDDFGVREAGLTWQSLTEEQGTNAALAQLFHIEPSTPREKKVEEVFHFSPTLLGLPPDSIVEVRASASDFYPDRQPSETPAYRIHILGNERHAEWVRQNLESLLTRLEDVTRLEEKVNSATREALNLPPDKLTTPEAAERVRSAKEDQLRNTTDLDELAEEGKKTLREAFRNPTFSEEVLRNWTKTLQDMQKLSQQNMQQAAHALKGAQEDAEKRSDHLKTAAQKEEEILDALEQMQRKVNKGLDELQALTLAQRLRKIAADETEIAGRLQKIVPHVVGMFPNELPARFKDSEAFLAGEQESAHKETRVLHAEIGRFFERTQKPAYGQVNKQMNEAHVVDELDRIRGLIVENISMDAIQNLGSWSERLIAWASLLEPKDSSSSSGEGGGGGGSENEALMKELLGLLRVRDREINLRHRTALLEKDKANQPAYLERAKALASSQVQIREEMGIIQGINPAAELEFPLQDIIDSMSGVETFLNKPQTDRETDLAQTKSVELISDVINILNEQQQRGSRSQSRQGAGPSAEEMAFLMQMMAIPASPGLSTGMNPSGGGNLSGGTTDKEAGALSGNPSGKAGESRAVNRAGGSSANLPAEFRDALENYFKALETLEPEK